MIGEIIYGFNSRIYIPMLLISDKPIFFLIWQRNGTFFLLFISSRV